MSRLDELPPDQRAALSLLLRQRKSYAEVAVLLGIGQTAVHDRAHAALAVLAPHEARGLAPQQREEIADYMLGQQASIAERLGTRTLLGSSEPARAWAQALARELGTIADGGLPDIPAAATTAAPSSPPAPAVPRSTPASPAPAPSPASLADAVGAAPAETQLPSSRRGGALLLGTIAVVAVVAVVLITSGGSGSSGHARTTASKTSSTSTTSTSPGKVDATVALSSPDAKSRTKGAAEVISDGNARIFAIIATDLPATDHFYYAIWLYNSPTSAKPLAQAPTVGTSHKMEAYGPLPTYAKEYHEVLLTRETAAKPTRPGKIVLRGTLALTE